MKIGNKEITEITITDKDGELIATITDNDIVYHDDYNVVICGEIFTSVET